MFRYLSASIYCFGPAGCSLVERHPYRSCNPTDTRVYQRGLAASFEFQRLGKIGVERTADWPASFRQHFLETVATQTHQDLRGCVVA